MPKRLRAGRLIMTGHPELVEGCRDVCANNYVVMYKLWGVKLRDFFFEWRVNESLFLSF